MGVPPRSVYRYILSNGITGSVQYGYEDRGPPSLLALYYITGIITQSSWSMIMTVESLNILLLVPNNVWGTGHNLLLLLLV